MGSSAFGDWAMFLLRMEKKEVLSTEELGIAGSSKSLRRHKSSLKTPPV